MSGHREINIFKTNKGTELAFLSYLVWFPVFLHFLSNCPIPF